ncbi:MAG: hypothetical protein PHT03_02005 [Bacilli bacterium]|nr:hypothetical protein [Bacilli bacterium]
MNYKDFENYLSNFQTKITEYFQCSENEENNKINVIFSKLKHTLIGKQEAVEAWENEIINGENSYNREKDRLFQFAEELKKIDVYELPPQHDIDLFKKDRANDQPETISNLLNTYKRKKHNINYKISNLKRNQLQKIKENNDSINEENRNYKNCEAELLRRQNIDIQRSIDNNIKEYGGIEKNLLDINDNKGISEAKKKIKKIRMAGLKEQMSIRNKYALLLYQNSLSFKKFYEKKMLDHALINEDFNLKIKNFEIEKQEIEYQEVINISVFESEMQKQLLILEKENELAKINAQSKISEQIIDLKKQIAGIDIKKGTYLLDKIIETEKDIFAFDQLQVKDYQENNLFFYNQLNGDCNFLYEFFILMTETFFRRIHFLIEEKYQLRYRLFYSLKEYLFIGNKDKLLQSEYNYQDVFIKADKLFEEFKQQRTDRLESFYKTLHHHMALITAKIKEVMAETEAWCREEENFINHLENQYAEILSDGFKNSVNVNQLSAKSFTDNITAVFQKIDKEQGENKKCYHDACQKIELDYQNKNIAIDHKIKVYQEEIKDKIIQGQKSYGSYKKKSRHRIGQYKNNYNQNITQHEKALYKQYKEQLLENDTERQRKLKTL